MPVHIKSGGTWREHDPHVKVSGTWRAVKKVHVRVGGVWQEVYTSGPTVVVAATKFISKFNFGGACYAVVQVDADGDLYENSNAANNIANTSYETWLDAGLNSEVWVLATKVSGSNPVGPTLNVRHACTSDRKWYITAIGTSTKSCVLDIQFWDASTGGTNLDTQTVNLDAEAEDFGGCPLCCFTPDTLVSMARGIDVPIASIRAGDEVMTARGPERVEEVIVRHNVPVYRLTLDDGRTLNLTPDHPVSTDRGPASLSQHEYKDLGVPEKLTLGDNIYIDDGTTRKLVKIEHVRREPVVYTLSNSLFYANGVLAY